MPQLRFKKQFVPLILSGRKTATLRRWKRCGFIAGQRVYVPGAGFLIVEGVDLVQWNSLTAADAVADGFASMSELTEAIREIYPDANDDGKQWFRVRFHSEPAGNPCPEKKIKAKSAGKSRLKKRSRASQPPADILTKARSRVAGEIRAELDKAVRANRS